MKVVLALSLGSAAAFVAPVRTQRLQKKLVKTRP